MCSGADLKNMSSKKTAKGARRTIWNTREDRDKAGEAEEARKTRGTVAIDPKYFLLGILAWIFLGRSSDRGAYSTFWKATIAPWLTSFPPGEKTSTAIIKSLRMHLWDLKPGLGGLEKPTGRDSHCNPSSSQHLPLCHTPQNCVKSCISKPQQLKTAVPWKN